MTRPASCLVLLLACSAALAGESLLVNGDFEAGLAGWHELWTRAPKAGKAVLDTEVRRGGKQAVRIEHAGSRDWSLGQQQPLAVTPGQLYELRGWVRLEGKDRKSVV